MPPAINQTGVIPLMDSDVSRDRFMALTLGDVVPLAVLLSYFTIILSLLAVICRSLVSLRRSLDSRAYVFVALTLASFAHTWFYMFKFMFWSFANYELARGYIPSSQSLIRRMSLWLFDTSLFEQAWAAVCFGEFNWWWSQQLCLFTVGAWTIFLATEGRKHQVKLVWAYMLLGQLVAISVASNLFYLALVLSPPVSGSRTNAKASPVLFACVSMALGAVYLSPWTDGTTFLPNLLVMHGVIMIPLLLPAKFVKNSERSVLSVPLPMMHILVFAIALALHTRSTATALGDPPMSVLDFVNKAWSTLHSHPAQASIGWDIIWTSISFVVWIVMLPQEQAGQRIAVALFLLLATPLVSVGVLAPHILRPSEEEVEEKKNV